MQLLGVSDGGDVDDAERNLVTAPGDRLVETDPDCRARLALSASAVHDADTVRRDAHGCRARTCALSAGQASGARPGRSTRLRDNHARIKVERTHWRVKSPETG